MSAYLVSDKSLSVMAKSIEYWASQKPELENHNALWKALNDYHDRYLTQPTHGSAEVFMAEKLFANLLRFNMISLRERYDDADEHWGKTAITYEFDGEAPIVSIPVVIDLLDNWQYQACEGAAAETDFYKLTEVVKARLALAYVKKTRPYEDTVWGIDEYSELDTVKDAYVRR
jgi:hypothetical protein